MSANWEVSKSQRVCAITGKVLEVGDNFFSGLKEEEDSFVRLDYSQEAWEELEQKDEFFSFWRSKILAPDENKKKKLIIDVEAFYTFFCNLAGDEKHNRMLFRYLIALILVRKRVLKLEEIEKSPEGEALILLDIRKKEEVRVPVLDATEEELEAAQLELNEIFECATEEI